MKQILLVCVFAAMVFVCACREQTKEELFQQGMEFVGNGNHHAAVTLFKEALEKDPSYTDARLSLAKAYIATDKQDKAEAELEKVLRQRPDSDEVSVSLAEVYLKTKRPDKAINKLLTIQQSSPNQPRVLLLLAQSYAINGDLTASETTFRKALLTDPEPDITMQSRLGLAHILYASGRGNEGDKLVEKAIETDPENPAPYYLRFRKQITDRNRDEAIVTLKKIKQINPGDILAAYMLGMLYLDAGDIAQCREVAAKLIAENPEHPAGNRIDGIALYQLGDYEPAIQKLQRSINGMPDLTGYYFLGLANYKLGQLEQALSSFQTALDKSPEHVQSRLMVAQTLLKQRRAEDAIQQTLLALEQDPLNANAYNILGSAYLLQGKYDLAMEKIDKAIQINPQLAQAHLKKGLFNLASGNTQEGEHDLFNAVEASPEILNIRLLLASYHIKKQNYPKAIEIIEKGLTISPDSAILYNLMAAAKFGQNKHDEAVSFLQKAKKLQPDYFTPYFNLANFFISRNDFESALGEYQAILNVEPDQTDAMLRSAALHELLEQDDLAANLYHQAAETQKAQGYLALSSYQQRRGDSEAALQTLKKGYESLPDNPDMIVAYAESLEKSGQIDEAIQAYIQLENIRRGAGKPLIFKAHMLKGDLAAATELAEKEIAERPVAPQGYIYRSAVYAKRSEWQRATNILKQGASVCSNKLPLQTNLARLYTEAGDFDSALNTYNDILQSNPTNTSILFAKAALHDQRGDKKQAQDLYEEILEIDKEHVGALNNLSMLMVDIYSDKKRALELASKGFRQRPNDARIIDTLGYVLLKNGQTDKAIVFLEKSASLMPEEVSVQLHLAQAYKAAGRSKDALASLSSINKSVAQESEIKEVNALLNELN